VRRPAGWKGGVGRVPDRCRRHERARDRRAGPYRPPWATRCTASSLMWPPRSMIEIRRSSRELVLIAVIIFVPFMLISGEGALSALSADLTGIDPGRLSRRDRPSQIPRRVPPIHLREGTSSSGLYRPGEPRLKIRCRWRRPRLLLRARRSSRLCRPHRPYFRPRAACRVLQ